MTCWITVDGTDCKVREPRYEVGLSLAGKIVWSHGPFPCGANSDLSILRSELERSLEHDEKS